MIAHHRRIHQPGLGVDFMEHAQLEFCRGATDLPIFRLACCTRRAVSAPDTPSPHRDQSMQFCGLQAALSFTWRCIVGNGGSPSLSEDDSTRSRANFQYAQAGSARLGKGWRKQHCEVVKKKLWESFFSYERLWHGYSYPSEGASAVRSCTSVVLQHRTAL